MLDKVLVNHLDMMDDLENAIQGDFDAILEEIDIDELMANPQEVLSMAAEDMQIILIEKYYTKAAENGIKLAKDIVADGDIKIERTKDPNINEDVL